MAHLRPPSSWLAMAPGAAPPAAAGWNGRGQPTQDKNMHPAARPAAAQRRDTLTFSHVARRAVLSLLPPAALLPVLSLARAAEDASTPEAAAGSSSFYARWPYVQPSDILQYLRATATPGNADSVLAAIDEFAQYYPMYRSGPEKGRILEGLVRQEAPTLALELGTFMAYGSIHIARALPPGGRLISIEAGEEQAEVAREVLALAGLDDPARVKVVTGLSSDVLPLLAEQLPPGGRQAGFVFLDHAKPAYLPDLQLMEMLGLVGEGSLVLADNVVYPGTPDYLAHVQAPRTTTAAAAGQSTSLGSGSSSSSKQSSRGKAAAMPRSAGYRYDTRLVAAAFEVEQRYKDGGEAKRDALAVSRCLGPTPEQQAGEAS